MNARIGMIGMVMTLCAALAWAAEGQKAGSEKTVTLGSKRAMALQDVQQMQNALNSMSPLQTAGNSVRAVYDDASQMISKRLQTENAQPQETRSQAAIDQATERQQALNKINTTWNQETLPELTVRWNDINRKASALTTLSQSVFNMDQQWLQAGMDSEASTSIMNAISDKAKAIQSEIGDLSKEAQKQAAPIQEFKKD